MTSHSQAQSLLTLTFEISHLSHSSHVFLECRDHAFPSSTLASSAWKGLPPNIYRIDEKTVITTLGQCFLNFTVHIYHMMIHSADSDSVGLEWGLRFGMSAILPGCRVLLVHGPHFEQQESEKYPLVPKWHIRREKRFLPQVWGMYWFLSMVISLNHDLPLFKTPEKWRT